MGHHEYVDRSMPLWVQFLEENKSYYYIPDAEIELISEAAQNAAQLIGDQPVTIVSRGCGTKFLAKEGLLAAHFKNVAGVVYLDRSDAALEQSMAEGKKILPNAWHRALQADIYDPDLRYPVDGVEVGTCFGMTLSNIECFPQAEPPKEAYVQNVSAIRAQMRHGAHFITTFDHNHDKKSVEQAYAGQGAFAKDMLSRTGSIDPDAVDFVVKFYESSEILSHGFRFRKNTIVESRSGITPFCTGQTVWFNNSAKPDVNRAREWNQESGFSYIQRDIPTETSRRLGWHHLVNA